MVALLVRIDKLDGSLITELSFSHVELAKVVLVVNTSAEQVYDLFRFQKLVILEQVHRDWSQAWHFRACLKNHQCKFIAYLFHAWDINLRHLVLPANDVGQNSCVRSDIVRINAISQVFRSDGRAGFPSKVVPSWTAYILSEEIEVRNRSVLKEVEKLVKHLLRLDLGRKSRDVQVVKICQSGKLIDESCHERLTQADIAQIVESQLLDRFLLIKQLKEKLLIFLWFQESTVIV